jgi:hypothetical protein
MTSSKPKWNDLSPAARGGIVAGAVVQIGLLIFSLHDLKRRPADEIRGSKGLWRPVLFVNFIGPLLYLRVGRKR